MKPIFTFPFTVITMPSYRLKIQLGRKHGRWPTANPLIEELEWANEMAGVNHELRATLWGSESPWRADEALAAIAEASGGVAQDPALEAAVPDALSAIYRLRSARDVGFLTSIRYRPEPSFRILFPGLGADWNRDADVRIEGDPHRRRNSLGRRRAMAICYETARRRGSPGTLSAARLFPCTANGDEYPHPIGSFLLQIHP